MATEDKPPLLIGLTGSIGAGKSTVASMIAQTHPVLDTDRIARELMERDDVVRTALTDSFGVQTFLSDGTLDPRFLASLVFEDAAKLEALNSITHPPTIARVKQLAEELRGRGERLVFVESALIFEVGIEAMFDYTVAVIADMDACIERIMVRDRSDRGDALRRLRFQLRPEEKAGLADFTIRNNGSLDDLRRATASILLILSRLGRRQPS